MNKFFIFFIMGIAVSHSLKAQCNDVRKYDIYTPNGSQVVNFLMCESSFQTREGFDNYYAQTYPNATQITTYDGLSSTRKFNCHGYAWLRVEQGIDRWIGYSDTTDEDVYMLDGSYIQVSQETYPGKVSWASGDHSAVTTSQQGVFISKWNEYPLMQHAWNYSPFGSSNLKYYRIAPTISGPSSICPGSAGYFMVTNPPVSYTWSASSNLTLQSTSGNTVSFLATTAIGSAWVKILVAGVQVARYNLTVGTPVGGISGPYNTSNYLVGVVNPGTYQFIATSVPSSVPNSDVVWTLTEPNSPFTTNYGGKNPFVHFSATGSYTLKMKYNGTCGYSPYATKGILVTASSGSGGSGNFDTGLSLLSAYPNPASSVLDIEIEEELQTMLQSSSSAAISSSESVYRVRLVSVQTGAVEYNQVLSSSSGNLSVNVSTIPDGLYNLTLTQGSTLLHSETILIQH
jgi:hypothetical protein